MTPPEFGTISSLNRSLSAAQLRQQFGCKALGLTRVPIAWQPRSLLVSSDVGAYIECSRPADRSAFFASVTEKTLESFGPGGVWVRSSATEETLLDRGRFLSMFVLVPTAKSIEAAILNILSHFGEANAEGRMALVIQPAMPASARGHLANFRRVSKTRNQWQAEYELVDRKIFGANQGLQLLQFNSQRNEPPGPLVSLPSARNIDELKETLKSIGAWFAENVSPVVSIEWVLSPSGLWLVQCDDEVDPPDAVDPKELSLPQQRAPASNVTAPAPFELYQIGSNSDLRKLRALDEFCVPDVSSLPKIYRACADEIASILTSPEASAELSEKLDAFAPDRFVIRTDFVGAAGQGGMNLPRTESITGSDAIAWLTTTCQLLVARGIDLVQTYFLMHRFIAARASAWSYAEPRDRYVRVDSLWGIPDGIQFFPHDTFEYDLTEGEVIRPTIDYKPFLTWPTAEGSWKNLRVKSSKARGQSLPRSDVAYIAEQTAKIAINLDAPAQIMWFCGFPTWSEYSQPLPWYRERHTKRPVLLDAAPPLPEFVIRTIADAEAVKRELAGQARKLVLQPSSDVIRELSFIEAVAEAAKSGKHSVVLDGSPLAHAFHQLLELGVTVHSSRNMNRRRTIRKQDFGKLVRDKIPDTISQNGDVVTFGRAPRAEKRKLLVAKAFEELAELAQAEDGSRLGEFADLYEVISALLAEFETSWPSVIETAIEKRSKRGGFEKGIVLVRTSLPEQDRLSLLPGSTPQKREVTASFALKAATAIERSENQTSVPIARLLGLEDGIEIELGRGARSQKISLRVEADRIVVGKVKTKKTKPAGISASPADDELPF